MQGHLGTGTPSTVYRISTSMLQQTTAMMHMMHYHHDSPPLSTSIELTAGNKE